MFDLLTDTSTLGSGVWDFVTLIQKDKSISDLELLTLNEESHGAGTLEDARRFSFTTKDREIWHLISKSYLMFSIRIKKQEAAVNVGAAEGAAATDEYDWGNNAHNDASVQLTDNGCNIFDQCRYYIEDREIEHVDHTGVATLIDGLLTLNKMDEKRAIKHSQLWFLNEQPARTTYVKSCAGRVDLLIPLSRFFRFAKHCQHVFRGVQHRLIFTLQDPNALLMKMGNNTPLGKVYIENAVWVIPKITPSLEKQAEVESTLATSPKISMSWPAVSVFREQPPKQREIRVQLASTVHRPQRILIGLQKISRRQNQSQTSPMEFDNMGAEECQVLANSKRFPGLREIKADFSRVGGAHELYLRFLEACQDGHCTIDYETFVTKYPLWHIDISHHADELFDTSTFPQLSIGMRFREAPVDDFFIYIIVINEREATLDINEKKMIVQLN